MFRNEALEKIKAFGMTHQLVAEDLGKIGSTFGVELGYMPVSATPQDDVYYPQFDAAVRKES